LKTNLIPRDAVSGDLGNSNDSTCLRSMTVFRLAATLAITPYPPNMCATSLVSYFLLPGLASGWRVSVIKACWCRQNSPTRLPFRIFCYLLRREGCSCFSLNTPIL